MNQKDSLNNAKGRLMHFLGFLATLSASVKALGIGIPILLTTTSTRPRGHEWFRDATTMRNYRWRV